MCWHLVRGYLTWYKVHALSCKHLSSMRCFPYTRCCGYHSLFPTCASPVMVVAVCIVTVHLNTPLWFALDHRGFIFLQDSFPCLFVTCSVLVPDAWCYMYTLLCHMYTHAISFTLRFGRSHNQSCVVHLLHTFIHPMLICCWFAVCCHSFAPRQ